MGKIGGIHRLLVGVTALLFTQGCDPARFQDSNRGHALLLAPLEAPEGQTQILQSLSVWLKSNGLPSGAQSLGVSTWSDYSGRGNDFNLSLAFDNARAPDPSPIQVGLTSGSKRPGLMVEAYSGPRGGSGIGDTRGALFSRGEVGKNQFTLFVVSNSSFELQTASLVPLVIAPGKGGFGLLGGIHAQPKVPRSFYVGDEIALNSHLVVAPTVMRSTPDQSIVHVVTFDRDPVSGIPFFRIENSLGGVWEGQTQLAPNSHFTWADIDILAPSRIGPCMSLRTSCSSPGGSSFQELLTFNSVLSPSARREVMEFLAEKYELPIAEAAMLSSMAFESATGLKQALKFRDINQ